VLTELRQSKNITIRLRLDDLQRARALAEGKGIGYQTYMKMLLHDALERESQKTRRA
jgi:predicted DNA binding CopG/RHH family protein